MMKRSIHSLKFLVAAIALTGSCARCPIRAKRFDSTSVEKLYIGALASSTRNIN